MTGEETVRHHTGHRRTHGKGSGMKDVKSDMGKKIKKVMKKDKKQKVTRGERRRKKGMVLMKARQLRDSKRD